MQNQVRLRAICMVKLCLNYSVSNLFASKTIYFDDIGSQVTFISLMTLLDYKEHLSSTVGEQLKRPENFLERLREVF